MSIKKSVSIILNLDYIFFNFRIYSFYKLEMPSQILKVTFILLRIFILMFLNIL